MTTNKVIVAGFYIPPPLLSAFRPQTAGTIAANGFRLSLTGPTSFYYAIERSTNLVTWTPFVTNLVTSNQFEFLDNSPPPPQFRMYRARRLP
jgi:hypothetical protein